MQSYITFSVKYYADKAWIGCKVEVNYAYISFKTCCLLNDRKYIRILSRGMPNHCVSLLEVFINYT